jgi:hypothetical protein
VYKLFLILVFILIGLEDIFAQENIDEIILKYLETSNIDNSEVLVDKIYDLKDNPVDINSNDVYLLEILPFIKPNDIKRILEYRKRYGNYISIENLILVEGFTNKKLKKLKYFICVSNSIKNEISNESLLKNTHHQLLIRTSTNSKSKNDRYEGNNWRYLVKYKFYNNARYSLGLVMEKDPGEAFFAKHQKRGFDYYSGFLKLSLNKFIEKIYIGDYNVSWGQGLVLGNSFGSFKSKQTIDIGIGYNKEHGNTSSNENRFFRGIYTKLNLFKNISLRALYSKRPIDAKVDIKNKGIKSLPNTGYHRTDNEISYKDVSTENNYGTNIQYNGMYLQIGCNYLYSNYDIKILPSSYYWKKAEFVGKTNMNFSIDYRLNIANFFIYGEYAMSKNKCYAHFMGINYYSSNNLSLSLSGRKYDNNYHSKYANGFGEIKRTANEEGVYLGIEYDIFEGLKINSYFDIFRFKYPNYRMRNGGNGNEELLNIAYPYSKKVNFDFKFKREVKPLDKAGIKNTQIYKMEKYSYQFSGDFNIYENLKLCPRFEYLTFKHVNIYNKGMLMYLDIKSNFFNSRFKSYLRFCYYKTDNYSSRIYEYEHDVLYAFSFKPFYGEGNRMYLNMSYKLGKKITFYSKIAYSHKQVGDNIEFTFQFRYKL